MHRFTTLPLAVALSFACGGAGAETYKCVQGGKSVFSDTPCAASANRVDQHSDGISRDQRRQAEIINQRNQSQLSELEYSNARNQYQRGGVQVLPGDTGDNSPARNSRTYR